MKDFFRLFKYIKPYWRQAVINLVCNLIYVIFSFFSLTLLAPFLSVLFNNQVVNEPSDLTLNAQSIIENFNYYIYSIKIEHGSFSALLFIVVLFGISSLIYNLFRYLGLYVIVPLRNNAIRDMRNDFYRKLTILPVGYFNDQRRGDILSRMSSDILELEITINNTLHVIIKDTVNVVVFTAALIYMSPHLILMMLVVLPVAAWAIGKIGKSLKRNAEKGQNRLGGLIANLEESISGIRIIKAFNAFGFASERFKEANTQHAKAMKKVLRRRDAAAPLIEFIAIVAMCIVIFYGGRLVLNNELRPELLILFVLLFARMIPPAQALVTSFYTIQKGNAAAKRVFEILDESECIVEKENAILKPTFDHNITYQNVSFAYTNNPDQTIWVLKNINFTIEKGKMIAIVGSSGSGKTTLADLLPRFYDTISGDILIDGVSIKDLNINNLRSLIGIVTQESILFNDTIFNNIAFGKTKKVDKEDVVHAARIANAHDFIMEMPDKYYTNIGDRGSRLSGGQKQRISIARAVLKNPPILILDEATSALDTESERLVQEALNNLMKNRTSIVIAHRLSTITSADMIIVLENGCIVDSGTHNELMQHSPVYQKLVKLQALEE